MKKFVVSFISFHDSELKSEIVVADSRLEVIFKSSFFNDEYGYNYLLKEYEDLTNDQVYSAETAYQLLKNFAYNCDETFEVIEVFR